MSLSPTRTYVYHNAIPHTPDILDTTINFRLTANDFVQILNFYLPYILIPLVLRLMSNSILYVRTHIEVPTMFYNRLTSKLAYRFENGHDGYILI